MTETQRAMQEARVLNYEHLVYKVFELNEDGKKWLETVKEDYLLNQSVSVVQNPSGGYDFCEKHAFFRDGQNSFIRSLMQLIESHKARMKQQNAKKGE